MSITTALKARRDQLDDREAGFTLIELLVVVIIIGILAAIAIPVYIGVQNNAKNSSAQSDLTNAKTAYVAYYTDKSTAFTTAQTSAQLSAAIGNYGYTAGTYSSGFAPKLLSGSSTGTTLAFCMTAKSDSGDQFYITATTAASTTVCS
jgi:type IV pilus assembly protein PilA